LKRVWADPPTAVRFRVNKLLTLQRRVQTEIIKKGRDKLRNLSKAIGDKYEEIDKLRERGGKTRRRNRQTCGFERGIKELCRKRGNGQKN
jgi:hypothetical protein